tara:strand:+ start:1669 stop:2046 length:378 start_codon:yes stop_codon:yes gene_type:complete
MSKLFFIKKTNCRGEVSFDLSSADFNAYIEMYTVFLNIVEVHNDVFIALEELERIGYDNPVLQELFCQSIHDENVIDTIRSNYTTLTSPRGLTVDFEEGVLGVGFTKQQAINALVSLDIDLDQWV